MNWTLSIWLVEWIHDYRVEKVQILSQLFAAIYHGKIWYFMYTKYYHNKPIRGYWSILSWSIFVYANKIHHDYKYIFYHNLQYNAICDGKL